MRLCRRTPRHERARRLLNIAAELSDLRYANVRYRQALEEIARRPTVERNPDGDDQAAHTMQLIARETLAASTDEASEEKAS